MSITSVIVSDLDLKSVPIPPREADPPPVVDPDGVLPLAAPLQRLQVVARRHAKILKRNRPMEDQEFPPRRPADSSKPRDVLIMKEPLGARRPKRPNHRAIITF